MHLLEERFLRKFEPHDGGYLFHQWDRSVVFTRAEVDGFVAARRRAWSNPWLWSLWLLIGVAAPVVLWLPGGAYSRAQAVLLALVSAVVLAVVLNHAESKADDAAQARITVGPGSGRPASSPWWNFVLYVIWAYYMFTQIRDVDNPWWLRGLVGATGLLTLWQLFRFVRGLMRART